ncbi:MAG: hypothetical protein HY286_10245 [Planctomycetes bacterium]|nr:hypothetical protein [Planctomycetota bacterium]
MNQSLQSAIDELNFAQIERDTTQSDLKACKDALETAEVDLAERIAALEENTLQQLNEVREKKSQNASFTDLAGLSEQEKRLLRLKKAQEHSIAVQKDTIRLQKHRIIALNEELNEREERVKECEKERDAQLRKLRLEQEKARESAREDDNMQQFNRRRQQ